VSESGENDHKPWDYQTHPCLSAPYLYSLTGSENRLESATTKLCNVTTHLGLRIRRQSTEGSSCQSGKFHHGTATISTPVIQWPIIMFSLWPEMWQIQPAFRQPHIDIFHIKVKMAVRLYRMGQVESSNIAHPKKMPRKSDESRGKFNLFNLFGHSHRLDKSVRIAAPRGHSFPLLWANALARLQKGSESTVQGVDLRSDLNHI
jgi:hypothetical protein